ncbi:MAG: ABC transporter ATP-binding protein, partial [Lachnospiraceae bacterium]|nr:ABC transporter ATP-binding protein [Lachnospiraceae bacterium]
PDGYDTDLGQGGVNVSGGQKQRLCIARAILKKPKILILDDSASALDFATEASLRQALKDEMKGTTCFIVSQRTSSIMHADKIIVLEDGKVDGIGTHEELLKTSALYKEIFLSQFPEKAGELDG